MLRSNGRQVRAYSTVPSGLGKHSGKFECVGRTEMLIHIPLLPIFNVKIWTQLSNSGRNGLVPKRLHFSHLQLTQGRGQSPVRHDLREALHFNKLYYFLLFGNPDSHSLTPIKYSWKEKASESALSWSWTADLDVISLWRVPLPTTFSQLRGQKSSPDSLPPSSPSQQSHPRCVLWGVGTSWLFFRSAALPLGKLN